MNAAQKFDWKLLRSPLHIWICFGVLVLDQLTKWIVIWTMPLGSKIELLSFFELVHIKNRGAAFGIFHDASPAFRAIFFGIVTLVCVWLLLNWLGSTPVRERLQRIGLSLILGGALGNVIDRVFFGEVTDFVHVFYRNFSWPAFNVADSAISVGVVLILGTVFWQWLQKRRLRAS